MPAVPQNQTSGGVREMSASSLQIQSVIGFSGKVSHSLHYTPCGRYIVYPLGSFVVLKNLATEKEAFIDGHTNLISCMTISEDGSKLASGQINISGVKVRCSDLYTCSLRACFVDRLLTSVFLPFISNIDAYNRRTSLFGIWTMPRNFLMLER